MLQSTSRPKFFGVLVGVPCGSGPRKVSGINILGLVTLRRLTFPATLKMAPLPALNNGLSFVVNMRSGRKLSPFQKVGGPSRTVTAATTASMASPP